MPTTQEGRILKYTTGELEDDFLLIQQLRAAEGISQLFKYDLVLLHEETQSGLPTLVDPASLLDKRATITIEQTDGVSRHFNGLCIDFMQGGRNERFTKYNVTLVPDFWILTQNSQSRIFQNKSVPEILAEVLDGFNFSNQLEGTYEPRNYCVQYRESDWDFASRLMEEEGIFYFFQHSANEHRLILADSDGSIEECPAKAEIPFVSDTSAASGIWAGQVLTWQVKNKIRSGKYMLRDHNFELPTNRLETTELSRFDLNRNRNYEIYDYPGGYAKRFDGIDSGGGEQPSVLQKVFDDRERTIAIRQQQIDVQYRSSTGNTDCSAMIPGFKYTLTTHPNRENNRSHTIVTLQTEALQSPAYISDEPVEHSYISSFVCIPQGENQAPFRPMRRTPRPIVQGSQTAIVVGPAGEEIFTDKYGRVKVQFHWDREGRSDANSSCWIRVGTLWAGKQWGVIHIPRIGQEVIVDFLEGDPDQPIIVGSVYNPETMPPYALPDNKTQSGVKSRSSKNGSPANFNEFRFEDLKGSEEIYLHAEKNWTIMVENDKNQIVGHDETHHVKHNRTKTVDNDEVTTVHHDRTETVDNNETITIGVNRTESVGSNEAIVIGSNQTHDVGGNRTTSVGKDETGSVGKKKKTSVGDKYTLTATNEINESSKKIVLTAGAELVLQGPGGQIKIDASGVTITGVLVKIN